MLTLRRNKSRTAPPAPNSLIDGLPYTGGFLYPERDRKPSFVISLPMKIAGGIACSLLGTMIINAASLKDYALAGFSGAGMVCSTVNRVFGDPFGGLKDKLGMGDGHAAPSVVINPKTPEQIEAERQAERTELVAEADALGLSWKEDWPVEKLRVEVREAKKRKAEADKLAREQERERRRLEAEEKAARDRERAAEERAIAKRAAEAEERAELVARATAIGFGVNASLPIGELRRQVKVKEAEVEANAAFQLRHRRWEAAMAAYTDLVENGRNAVCPNCRMWMHISPTASSGTGVMCKGCKLVASRAVFRSGFNPPPPPVEPVPGDDGGGGFFSGFTGGFQ